MWKKILISALLILGGCAIFLFGNPWIKAFPTNKSVLYTGILTGVFLVIMLVFKRVEALEPYRRAVQALFIASAAMLFLSTGVLNLHKEGMPPLKLIALDKFSQFLHVVPLVIVLALLFGWKWEDLFLAKGNLKEALLFGGIAFAVWTIVALIIGIQKSSFFTTLWQSLPLVLLFVISNAVMEELWFRGIFLKQYEPLIGQWAAIILTAFVFAAPHFFATYDFPGGRYVFAPIVFCLGLVGAYVMFKHDSILGAILFHAGYDLMVIVQVMETV
ncbi:MAG: type II CAAX endopeptidase family protein [Anaerolineae bacterium]|jgi:membrane protease YdiL (CAAX protease family)|nr:type II CAAX endopeptidase family protein [Anaerolineae bacterium]